MFSNSKQKLPDIFQEVIDLEKKIKEYEVNFRDPENKAYFQEMCKDIRRVRDACATFIQRQKGGKA